MSTTATAPSWDYIAKLVCIGDSGCGKSSLTIRLCEGRFVAHHDVTIGVEFGSRIVPVGPPHTAVSSKSPSAPSEPVTCSSSSRGHDQHQQQSSPSSPPKSANPTGLPAPPLSKTLSPKGRPPETQRYMKLSLWDTAGQETYKSVTRSYFRGASGALLVFDLSRRSTFLHVTDWLSDLRQIAEPDIVVVLVGNKADLVNGGDGRREVTRDEAEEWARTNGVLEYVETSAKSGEGVEKAFGRVAERIYQNIQAGKYDLNDRRSGVKGSSAGGAGGGITSVRLTEARRGGGCC